MNKNDPTDKFENELKKEKKKKKLKEYLSKLDKLEAGLYLQKLLDEKGKKVKDIVDNGNVSESLIYKFIGGKRGMGRDKILIIACSISLSVEETNKLLKMSGHNKLYAKDKRDSLLIYALENKKSVEEIVLLIEENDIDFEIL